MDAKETKEKKEIKEPITKETKEAIKVNITKEASVKEVNMVKEAKEVKEQDTEVTKGVQVATRGHGPVGINGKLGMTDNHCLEFGLPRLKAAEVVEAKAEEATGIGSQTLVTGGRTRTGGQSLKIWR